MIELTEEQRQELAGPQPVRVRDPQTKETYVLVGCELYERMKAILNEDLDSRAVGILVQQTMAEYDSDDPLLESYQQYRKPS